MLSYKTALNITAYLKHEMDYVPLLAATQELKYLTTMLRKTDAEEAYKKFLVQILAHKVSSIGFMPHKDDPFLTRMLRKLLLEVLCSIDYEPCVTLAKSLYEAAKNTSRFTCLRL